MADNKRKSETEPQQLSEGMAGDGKQDCGRWCSVETTISADSAGYLWAQPDTSTISSLWVQVGRTLWTTSKHSAPRVTTPRPELNGEQ